MDGPDLLVPPSGSPWARIQAPGDIVLTTGAGPGAMANRLLQSLVEGRWACATHAMLVAAPGLYLDAGPRQGVALVPAERYAFAAAAGSGLRRRRLAAVLRHPELAASRELRAELARVARAFCGCGYNFRLLVGPWRADADRRRAFCSELVVAVFEQLGWRDVTAIYARGLEAAGPSRG